MIILFIYKIREAQGGTGPACGGGVPVGGGEKVCKVEYIANTVYSCT
jgi:hypothetical protein